MSVPPGKLPPLATLAEARRIRRPCSLAGGRLDRPVAPVRQDAAWSRNPAAPNVDVNDEWVAFAFVKTARVLFVSANERPR